MKPMNDKPPDTTVTAKTGAKPLCWLCLGEGWVCACCQVPLARCFRRAFNTYGVTPSAVECSECAK